jgi:hypothetical protein
VAEFDIGNYKCWCRDTSWYSDKCDRLHRYYILDGVWCDPPTAKRRMLDFTDAHALRYQCNWWNYYGSWCISYSYIPSRL